MRKAAFRCADKKSEGDAGNTATTAATSHVSKSRRDGGRPLKIPFMSLPTAGCKPTVNPPNVERCEDKTDR